jgi:hypothetical protein
MALQVNFAKSVQAKPSQKKVQFAMRGYERGIVDTIGGIWEISGLSPYAHGPRQGPGPRSLRREP